MSARVGQWAVFRGGRSAHLVARFGASGHPVAACGDLLPGETRDAPDASRCKRCVRKATW